ncbi:MAG: hypothetical protein ACXADY_22875 [Candidatus Hodarchaeales archaeon]|jgi:hypothetical protein
MILGLLISGIGFGLLTPNLSVQLGIGVSQSIRGRIFSGFTSFVFLGQFISPIVSQTLLQFMSPSELFTFGGGIMFLIALLIFLNQLLHLRHSSYSVES